MNELADVSDEALMEMASHILLRDEEAVVEAIDALAAVTKVPANVAERHLTGRYVSGSGGSVTRCRSCDADNANDT